MARDPNLLWAWIVDGPPALLSKKEWITARPLRLCPWRWPDCTTCRKSPLEILPVGDPAAQSEHGPAEREKYHAPGGFWSRYRRGFRGGLILAWGRKVKMDSRVRGMTMGAGKVRY